MSDYIDVIVPRGGKGLVKKVKQLSNVNVIGHLKETAMYMLIKMLILIWQKKLF